MLRRAMIPSLMNWVLVSLTLSLHTVGGEQGEMSNDIDIEFRRIPEHIQSAINVDQDIVDLRDEEEGQVEETDYCNENSDEPECNLLSADEVDDITIL